MANATRARVELRPSKHKSPEEQFKEMLHVFKRRCNEANIMHDYKEHEFFVSKSEKKRKKKREAEAKARKERQEQQARANGVVPRSKKRK
jgi:ribosomal protein S21